ncbi:MAG: hypothetical protein D8M59_03655 [Planctomycetes bacterium]|nr:hypothetical protein [Planctomycetota bacterium]NOG53092.1 hypothetical protein [Planctomycetota bacterium]
MIIIPFFNEPVNALSLPFLVAVWAIEMYLWLLLARVCLRPFTAYQGTTLAIALTELTNPVRNTTDRMLRSVRITVAHDWALWLMGCCALYLARSVLLQLALSIQNHIAV